MALAGITDSTATQCLAVTADPRGRNATRQGAFASPTAIVPGEDPQETPQLLAQFEAHFAPEPGPAAETVRNLAMTAKRMRRVDRAMEAYYRRAVEKAQRDLPDELKRLEADVRDLDVENALAERLLDEVAQAYPDQALAAQKLAAYAPVLDRLLNLPQPTGEMVPMDAVIRGNEILAARSGATEPFRKALDEARERHRADAEESAAVDSVTSAAAERLSRERASLHKAFLHGMHELDMLRGTTITERMVIERKTPKQTEAAGTAPFEPKLLDATEENS